MKKILILCMGILCSIHNFAQAPTEVKTQANTVTIFNQGAQVYRKKTIQLPKGISELKFIELSPNIHPGSIHVKSASGITILSVNHQKNYLNKIMPNSELDKLNKMSEQLNQQIINEKTHISILKEEIDLLQKNKELSGKNTPITATQLQQFSNYFSQKMTELKFKENERNNRIKDLNKQLSEINNQIEIIAGNRNNTSSEIYVKVNAAQASNANFELSYLVSNAGWTPSYDLRATSINRPITLIYKANIKQDTKENWENVHITLSSAQPNEWNEVPTLSPYFVNFFSPKRYTTFANNELKEVANAPMAMAKSIRGIAKANHDEAGNDFVGVETHQGQTNVQFDIQVPYTIKSDNQIHTIEMQSFELPAKYQYYSVPKIVPSAFLLAHITDWEKLNILAGDANVFFENTFIGKTSLHPNHDTDTLKIALGKDKNIAIHREKIKQYSSKQFIGNKKIDSKQWQTTIRNNKRDPIEMIVIDQIPISTQKDIEIIVEQLSNGLYNKDNGEIKWHISLLPNEKKQLKIEYAAKYPSDKNIILE